MSLKLLFLGDVVGAPGRKVVARALPKMRDRWSLDLVVCNAENSAGGSGFSKKCHDELTDAGVDVFTLGDHAYRNDEVHDLFARSGRILRAANYPPESPGAELAVVQARDGTPVAVFTLMGRTFMKPVDCPFRAAERILERIGTSVKVILVDVHAEATSDKQLLGRFLDGRAPAVLGTHTHVPTADQTILPGGTAFCCDVGMTGPYDSILGRRYDKVLAATLSQVPERFDVATGDPRLCGALVEIDPDTGHAESIQRIDVGIDQVESIDRDGPRAH